MVTTTKLSITAAKKKRVQEALRGLKAGRLHAKLGLKKGQKIPGKLLNKAMRSKNPTIRRQASLAVTLVKFF